MRSKKYRVDVRCNEETGRKLEAICRGSKRSKTNAIETMIQNEYNANIKLYRDHYWNILNRE